MVNFQKDCLTKVLKEMYENEEKSIVNIQN